MRLLFVYAFAPSGHASAACALAARAQGLGHQTNCLDITSDYHKVLGPALNNIYLTLIQSFPNLWTAMHDNESAAEILSNWRKIYHLFAGQRLLETVVELKPDRIVCTHAGPFAALALAKEKDSLRPKLVGVSTDFQPHPYWAVPGADLYVVATAGAADTMAARGIPRGRLLDVGIPVHPVFDAPPDRAAARGALGIAEDERLLLLSGGSRGLGRLAEACEALLAGLPGVRLAIVCGSNDALYERLRGLLVDEPRARLHQSLKTADMRRLMEAADLMIGKAGGLTSAECLALGLPMVVLDPIAGQEQANADFLERAGAAMLAKEPESLASLVGPLLKSRGLDGLRAAARALGRPDAGQRVLEAILA